MVLNVVMVTNYPFRVANKPLDLVSFVFQCSSCGIIQWFIELCVHKHVIKTKGERNSSLEYYHMTYIGKTNIDQLKRSISLCLFHCWMALNRALFSQLFHTGSRGGAGGGGYWWEKGTRFCKNVAPQRLVTISRLTEASRCPVL